MPPGNKGLGKILSDAILLLIAENPTYGYEISDRLEEFGISFPNTIGQKGRIYRVLSMLEEANLIFFEWDITNSPPRKIYNITDSGKEYLHISVEWAKSRVVVLNAYIKRVEKIVSD
ncbi:MAG: PadR family transcriptional regulator [Calditrichia bacterium]|nr:PadR family transcriptional regulator [Calditrichia bacterium]